MDCTLTFHTGAGTGIQRVVRRYADGLLEIAAAHDVHVVPVRISGGQLVPLPIVDNRVAFPVADAARSEERKDRFQQRLDFVRGVGHRANFVRSRAFARWLDAGPNGRGLARSARSLAPAADASGSLQLARGDILLLLDSSWVYDVRSVLDAAGRAGVIRAAVLCDVLPLRHPEWFTNGTRNYFEDWIQALLPRLEGVVAISEATCRDLAMLVATERIQSPRMPSCSAVHLGAEIAAAPDAAAVRPELRNLLASDQPPAFLTVGTLEPRKNVDFALDLFERLLARGLDLQWHVIGSAGWLSDGTADRIRAHPEFGTRLFWWTDLKDGELAWAYRHAGALVAISRAEGFGLPLVEARLAGLPVFASDIPVFREIMQGEATYLPLDRPSLAAAALEDFLARGAPRPSEASRIARTWGESTMELLARLQRLAVD